MNARTAHASDLAGSDKEVIFVQGRLRCAPGSRRRPKRARGPSRRQPVGPWKAGEAVVCSRRRCRHVGHFEKLNRNNPSGRCQENADSGGRRRAPLELIAERRLPADCVTRRVLLSTLFTTVGVRPHF
ncbi:Hypothetical predicted protein [Cloeon dipterum]|uniref:Uncharacterized protein n=1 Tax=Cloeon dipterum TaxID=197152 RepID=A0A8S1BMN1_9INSE|nr:Hypothetical predicted protein [Cloeon dipterum]